MRDKRSLLLFCASFIVLLIFSYHFAMERVLFADTAVSMFKIANYQTFYVTNYRFISLLQELPAVIGAKLHFPVKTLVQLYSLGDFLPEMLVAGLLIFVLKDYRNLLVLILVLVLLNNLNFYYIYAEFHKGLSLSVLFLSLFQQRDKIKISDISFHLISLLLYVIILFAHPLTFICILFTFAYLYAKNQLSLKTYFFYNAFVIFTAVLKLVLVRTAYETEKFSSPVDLYFFRDNILLGDFMHQLLQHNFIFGILFLVAIFSLMLSKKFKLLFFFILFTVSYFLLIIIKFKTKEYDYYTECFFRPMAFFLSVVVIHELFVKYEIRYLFLCVAVGISLSKMYHHRKVFEGHLLRYEQIMQIMQEHHINKALLSGQLYQFKKFDDRWPSSYESILLSKILYKGDTTRTFCITFSMKEDRAKNEAQLKPFIDMDEWINPEYFKLPEEKYVVIDSLYENAIK
ncbi:MAG: hypothetical protein JWN78_2207 [Bacteroidota bacterium]|nr:hypothetical protein [Bacteroidota bacterium]